MPFQRILNIIELLDQKSIFLFGPRSTGKTFLILQQMVDTPYTLIDLLQGQLYFRLQNKPWELEKLLPPERDRIIVIDEVQRVPELLNEAHRLITHQQRKFLLTGSSARKLRHGGVNLLAGRAWQANLFPLVSAEIPEFDLMRYLHYGSLPMVQLSAKPVEELYAYVDTYLKEEIQAEALVRNVVGFSRFLEFAGLTSGQIINFTALANDAGLPISTVREYYQILEDTLLGFFVPAWRKSKKRKPTAKAKFYLFDLGVRNTLANIKTLPPQSDLFGQAFEHFIALELRAYISYRRLRLPLSYWHTKHGQEVDFIIGDEVAIEVKSTQNVSAKHWHGLKLLAEETICRDYWLVTRDPLPQHYDKKLRSIHWKEFLAKLWNDQII